LEEFRQQVLGWAGILGPNIYVQAVLVLLIFSVAGKFAELFLSRVVLRIVQRSSVNVDDELIRHLQRPVRVTFTLVGLAVATRVLDLSETPTYITLGVLRTIAILIWYSFLRRAFTMILSAIASSRAGTGLSTMVSVIETVARVVLLALAIYFIFLAWRIDVTAWLASAGIIGLALSFAAKDTLANLFAGVTIAADSPYKTGDFITLESGERGMVTHIGLRSTRLLTRDDVEITVPNGIIGNGKIINEAGGPSARHRIRLSVGVAYGSDIDLVIDTLNEIAESHTEVCDSPAARVRFREFGDSSLNFELLCWIERPVDRGRLVHELNCAIYKGFIQAGVEIPFPQRDLHVRSMPALPGEQA